MLSDEKVNELYESSSCSFDFYRKIAALVREATLEEAAKVWGDDPIGKQISKRILALKNGEAV